MKCPCENCLIIPVCKQKSWSQALDECRPLRTYLDRNFDKDETAPRSQSITVPFIKKKFIVSKFNRDLMVADGRIPAGVTQKIKRMVDDDAV